MWDPPKGSTLSFQKDDDARMNPSHDDSPLPRRDDILLRLADYVADYQEPSQEAWKTARLCLSDSLGCAMLALNHPECMRMLGPIVPESHTLEGTPIPGTGFRLDPVAAAFNIGTLIRWLDFNDTFLASEWGHPSDNLGALLAIADNRSRRETAAGREPFRVRDLLLSLIKAYEIQGVLSLQNSLNREGFDHVLFVKAASAAVATQILGGTRDNIADALSQAFIDGGSLRAYRHAPNTGSRKSWAAGDASARGLWLALITLRGEMGYPAALSAPHWGFNDVVLSGKPLALDQNPGCYVMENILFKIAFPAEFHAQTAVECAFALHPRVHQRLEEIDRIEIHTQESAKRIIDKTGPLHNPADRDHCLQYMVAIGLLFGKLTADHYSGETAKDPRIDALRDKMRVEEDPRYSRDYLNPKKRSIANAVQVFFRDGSSTEKVEIEYPLGHRRRRQEALDPLQLKLENNISSRFHPEKTHQIINLFHDAARLEDKPVCELLDLFQHDA